MQKTFEIQSETELEQVADFILKSFPDERVFLFYGDLGSGKTTLIKFLCKKLNCESQLSSPTYAIINEYQLQDKKLIYHADLYRLKNLEEALDIGIEEYLESGMYFFIEWPEVIEKLLVNSTIKIEIATENYIRLITVKKT